MADEVPLPPPPNLESRSRSFTGRVRRLVFLLAIVFGHPTGATWIAGAVLFLFGALAHVWTCGYLHRNEELIRSGPYRMVRHPLYMSNALVDVSFCIISNNVFVLLAFVVLFCWTYGARMDVEEMVLRGRYPQEYDAFAGCVGRVVPRPSLAPSAGQPFRWTNFYRNSLGFSREAAFCAYGAALALWFHVGDPLRLYREKWDTGSIVGASGIGLALLVGRLTRWIFREGVREATVAAPTVKDI